MDTLQKSRKLLSHFQKQTPNPILLNRVHRSCVYGRRVHRFRVQGSYTLKPQQIVSGEGLDWSAKISGEAPEREKGLNPQTVNAGPY